jgi:NitT/TauT family transport system substrate-binding protein
MSLIAQAGRAFVAAALLAAASQAALADDHLKLAVGARGNWETAAPELGNAMGFFKKRGLELEILYTQGSGETQQAVISGSVDIGVGLGTTSVMNAFVKGAPLRVIGNVSSGSSEYWYVRADSPVHSMKDAAGRTIAYSTAGASSHMEVLGFMKYYGFEAKPVATGNIPSTRTQVMSGQVDVGWASFPFGLELVKEGKIRMVGRGSELPYFRDQTIRLLVVHAPYLEQHKDVVARFVQAYRDTLDWMYTSEAALKAYADFAHVPQDIVKQTREDFYPREEMSIDHVAGLDAVMADGVSFKYLAAPLSKEQLSQLFQIPAPIK